MLQVEGLVKRFGSNTVVDRVSFRVAPGESVGLLGPNGAGKTTTVSLICGLLRPDGGGVRFDGRPIRSDSDPHKRRIGLVPQELALIEEITARENLLFFGSLQGLKGTGLSESIARGLDMVGLAARARDPVRTFSGGMKRRLNLAAALLHDPALIILDEPTVGVDPQSRNAIFEGLEALKADGKSLLYTTHYMEEAERLCDRLVIIDHGKVVADGGFEQLAKSVPRRNRIVIELEPGLGPTGRDRLAGIEAVLTSTLVEDRLELELVDLRDASRVLDALNAKGTIVRRMASERVDLQSIFLDLTGRGVRDT